VSTWLSLAGLPGPRELLMFCVAVFLLNATPGVDMLLTISRTLQSGARAGLAAAAGICAGCALHALGAAFGLAALLAVSPLAFQAVQVLGAGYLLWLAAGLLRASLRQADARQAAGAVAPRPAWVDVRIGLLTNVLNPKVALFFLAFLPQFIAADATDKTRAFLGLGAWFVVQSALFLAALVLLCSQLTRVRWPDGLRRVVQALAGGCFVLLALRLALARPSAA